MAKVDDGFKQSEKMLNDLERRIHKEYAKAKKEMGEKVTLTNNLPTLYRVGR